MRTKYKKRTVKERLERLANSTNHTNLLKNAITSAVGYGSYYEFRVEEVTILAETEKVIHIKFPITEPKGDVTMKISKKRLKIYGNNVIGTPQFTYRYFFPKLQVGVNKIVWQKAINLKEKTYQ